MTPLLIDGKLNVVESFNETTVSLMWPERKTVPLNPNTMTVASVREAAAYPDGLTIDERIIFQPLLRTPIELGIADAKDWVKKLDPEAQLYVLYDSNTSEILCAFPSDTVPFMLGIPKLAAWFRYQAYLRQAMLIYLSGVEAAMDDPTSRELLRENTAKLKGQLL